MVKQLQSIYESIRCELIDVLSFVIVSSFSEVFRRSPQLFLEGHGREHFNSGLDPSNTIGWFTTLSPLQLSSSKIKPGDLIRGLTKVREMVHQLTRAAEEKRSGFVLQDLHIQTALVMRPGQTVELITEARHESETGPEGSAWWEISITSFRPGGAKVADNNGIWTKYCTCRARAADSQKVSGNQTRYGFPEGVENNCLR